jgi:hypothetical protein
MHASSFQLFVFLCDRFYSHARRNRCAACAREAPRGLERMRLDAPRIVATTVARRIASAPGGSAR